MRPHLLRQCDTIRNLWAAGKDLQLYDMRSVLEFLNSGFDLFLATSTWKVQVATLSVYLEYSLMEHPFASMVSLSIPPWDLQLILEGHAKDPFKPLEECDLGCLGSWRS